MLACAAGATNNAVAVRLGTREQTVAKWRGRFVRHHRAPPPASGQAQVVQPDVIEAAPAPRLELGLELLTDPRHRRPRHGSPLPERLDQRGLHVRVDKPRTNEAITSVSNARVLVTCVPNSCEANRSLVPRSFGRCKVTGPVVVFTVVSQYPLRVPGRASSVNAARAYRSRPRNAVTSASNAACNNNRAPSCATCSTAAARSPDSANTRSTSAHNRSVGDTLFDTGVVPSS